MAKKEVKLVTETAAAAKPPAKPRTHRIQNAKHSRATVGKTAEAIAESHAAEPTLAHEEIAVVAYSYWESRGYQGGNALDDWFRAESELKRAAVN
jgi:hypothetical protein